MAGLSMKGSGIYSLDYTGHFFCSNCADEFELDGATDDSHHKAYAECPRCKSVLEKDLPDRWEVADNYWADYNPNK